MRELVESAGCLVVYLPPCSPDLNPIELAYSRLKALLRKHAERTKEGLWTRLSQLVETFTPDLCHNYFKHCGDTANSLDIFSTRQPIRSVDRVRR